MGIQATEASTRRGGDGRRPVRRAAAVAAAVALVATVLVFAPRVVAGPQSQAAAAGQYIVVLRDRATDPAAVAEDHRARYGARPGQVYRTALRGYVAALDPARLLALAADPRVASVEPDRIMRIVAVQSPAPWGLDRIDQRPPPLDGRFSYNSTGSGVKAYVIDTGVRASHREFGGRVVPGYDATRQAAGGTSDCNGHGTHVAGTLGGSTYGVAKGVTLVPVRVLDCSGTGRTSTIIAGVDWVTRDHQAGQPAVANLSLGGSASPALDLAVRTSIADGVSYAVAAGNGNVLGLGEDACLSSPGRVSEAMTVSATDRSDTKPGWANSGRCVDWFAPGVGITSSWSTSDAAAATISGTSMATPHTAGVAAQYLQLSPGSSPAAVRSALLSLATKGVVRQGLLGGLLGGTPNNHLLFTNL